MSDESRGNGEMKRREFLGTAVAAGGVAGAAAMGSSGCSAVLLQRMLDDMSPEAIDAFFSQLARGLDEIDTRQVARRSVETVLGPDALAEDSPEVRARADRADAMGRRILRSMLVAGMIHDLPREANLGSRST